MAQKLIPSGFWTFLHLIALSIHAQNHPIHRKGKTPAGVCQPARQASGRDPSCSMPRAWLYQLTHMARGTRVRVIQVTLNLRGKCYIYSLTYLSTEYTPRIAALNRPVSLTFLNFDGLTLSRKLMPWYATSHHY